MLQSIIALVLTNIVSIGGWLTSIRTSKRSANAAASVTEGDANLKQLDITTQIINIYKGLSEDMKKDYEAKLLLFTDDIASLKAQLLELQNLKCFNTSCINRLK